MTTDFPPSMMFCLPSMFDRLEILLPVSCACQRMFGCCKCRASPTVVMYSVLTERRVPTAGRDDILRMRGVSLAKLCEREEVGLILGYICQVFLRHFSHRTSFRFCIRYRTNRLSLDDNRGVVFFCGDFSPWPSKATSISVVLIHLLSLQPSSFIRNTGFPIAYNLIRELRGNSLLQRNSRSDHSDSGCLRPQF